MEAVPRLQMLSFALKISPEGTSFSNLKRIIAECYQEDAESYSKEVYTLESLRNAAMRPEKDTNGCKILKRYYSQLHALINRFPQISERNLFTFQWKDLNVNNITETNDIRYEMAAVLYNIAVLHTEVGATVQRTDIEGMKLACTHFQCAAWAFGELKEKFQNINSNTDFMTPELLVFMQQISFAQAQECILEKSLIDNRKPIIVARVTAQIINYYSTALVVLLSGGDDGFIFSQVIDNNTLKLWKKYVKFKISYLSCILSLYQGQHSEEQQKMGERVALYQAAVDKLEEARKESKGLPNQKEIIEALTFTGDVVEGKRKNAKNENEFIYHEAVPEFSDITAVQGANLVNGTSFSVTDPEIFGEDIFARLVPMKAHEASSLYSEEKAKILRDIGAKLEEKDNELSVFMSSLNIDNLNVSEEQANKIPQGIVDRCALLNAKPNAIPDLIASMSNLAEICVDVETNLRDIKEILDEEESKEKQYQQSTGVHRPNTHFTELTREFQKYLEAHQRAGDSNDTLRKAMELHVNNLKILSKPLQEIQQSIPKLSGHVNDEMFKELKLILNKVNEMKAQRAQFHADLRISINSDDITSKVIAHGNNDLKELFKKELGKHDHNVKLIEQNLTAQTNILTALTDAYAKCASSLKTMSDVKLKKENFFSSLAASYDVYEDLLAKSAKGLEFYKKLQGNIQKLLTRVKAARDVQEEDRKQRIKSTTLAKNYPELSPSVISSAAPAKEIGSTPKLKDYLKDHNTSLKNFSGYSKVSDPSSMNHIPSIRPNPLGSENPAAAACIKSTTSISAPTNHSTYTPVGPMDPPPPYTPLPSMSNTGYDSMGFVNPIYQNAATNHPSNPYYIGNYQQAAQQIPNMYSNATQNRLQNLTHLPQQQVQQHSTSVQPVSIAQATSLPQQTLVPQQGQQGALQQNSMLLQQASQSQSQVEQYKLQSFQNSSLQNPNMASNSITYSSGYGSSQIPPTNLQQQQLYQEHLQQQVQKQQSQQTSYSPYQVNPMLQNLSAGQNATFIQNQMKNLTIRAESPQQPITNSYYQQSSSPQYNVQNVQTQFSQNVDQNQNVASVQQQQKPSRNFDQSYQIQNSQSQFPSIHSQSQQHLNQIVQQNQQQQNAANTKRTDVNSAEQQYSNQTVPQNYIGQSNAVNFSVHQNNPHQFSTQTTVQQQMQQQQQLQQQHQQNMQQQQQQPPQQQQHNQQQQQHQKQQLQQLQQYQQQFPNSSNFQYPQQNSSIPSQISAFGSHPGYSFNQSSGQYQYGSGYQYASNNTGQGQYTNSTNFQENKASNTTNVNQLAISSGLSSNYDKQCNNTNQKPSVDENNYSSSQNVLYANNTYQQPLPPFTGGMTQKQQDHLQPMIPNSSPLTYVQSNNNNKTETTTSSSDGSQLKQENKEEKTTQQTPNPQGTQNKSLPSNQSSAKLKAKPKSTKTNVDLLTDTNDNNTVPVLPVPVLQPLVAVNRSTETTESKLNNLVNASTVTDSKRQSISGDIDSGISGDGKNTDSKKIQQINESTVITSTPSFQNDTQFSSIDRKFSCDNISIHSDLSSLDQNFDWDSVSIQSNEKLSTSNDVNNVNSSKSSINTNQQKPISTDPFDDSNILKYFHKEVEHYEKVIDSLGVKMLNGNTPLYNKWKDLQDLLMKDESKRSANIAKLFPEKNRAPDSIPYDHARVVLERTTDDYINAAYVKDLGPGCPAMILAQTPLQNTINDFWSMVWNHKVRTVVCLHTPNEILDTYWPQNNDKELHFDDFSIEFVKQYDLSHCIEYNLKLTMNGVDAILNLSLLQIKSWSKNAPTHILEISRNILTTQKQRNQEFNSNSPLIMNCLTGSERSGLVALAICAILSTKTRRPTIIDVVDIWYRICSQRKNALKDANNLELSMKIVLCHAHNVLNQRGIMTSYQMKIAQTVAATEKEEAKDPLRELDPLWKLKQEK
ncbi:tyrosine-protein phosphatase non-receptor type 23 isoform X2 [Condylostylus longicornis]|uniref:tyrosine-protein phosphatase non-receptor type 23 isoform X2 n=1 Tax=Condylostylus longicornis TaxID=2530218 RepID=UPI00244E2DEF|nr:tyrosine-protein phosphatase non-receptor type 23 isoform X2 [Condylostylus longicornis]